VCRSGDGARVGGVGCSWALMIAGSALLGLVYRYEALVFV
jgi:hypothetical protein